MEEISEIHMEKALGLRCITKAEGIEVKMGWEQFEEKLSRLALIWTDLQKRGFSAASIDVYADGSAGSARTTEERLSTIAIGAMGDVAGLTASALFTVSLAVLTC
jgi:hypothetical protein